MKLLATLAVALVLGASQAAAQDAILSEVQQGKRMSLRKGERVKPLLEGRKGRPYIKGYLITKGNGTSFTIGAGERLSPRRIKWPIIEHNIKDSPLNSLEPEGPADFSYSLETYLTPNGRIKLRTPFD